MQVKVISSNKRYR